MSPSETPHPERPADDQPSAAAEELQKEQGDTDPDAFEDDPARNPQDESLKGVKGG